MALPEGTRVFVCYDLAPPEPELYHERYILASCLCGRGYHIVLTPDFDTYAEQISLENDDLRSYRVAAGGALPAGLTQANTYRFQQMPDAAMMVQFRRDAYQAAQAMSVVPGGVGVAAPMGAAAPIAPAVVGAVLEDEVWVRVESHGESMRGTEVVLDGSEVLHGSIGIKFVDGEGYAIRKMKKTEVDKFKGLEAAADARLLPLSFQGTSRTERQWRDVAKEVKEEKFEDWSIPGPRTAAWRIQFLNRKDGPMAHHRWWVQAHSLKPDAWGVAEHDSLMKAVDKMGRFDALDMANIAGVELIFRRLQLIEFIYSERGPGGGKGSSKSDKKDGMTAMQSYEATIFAGAHKEFGDVMVAPPLLDYVAKEVEGEAAVLKQVRKAREERAALNK